MLPQVTVVHVDDGVVEEAADDPHITMIAERTVVWLFRQIGIYPVHRILANTLIKELIVIVVVISIIRI